VTDATLVLAKLTTVREHVDRIERRRRGTFEQFRGDVDRQDALALSLIVALQESADIALHIASDQGWGVPPSYAAAFDLLAERGVIDRDLARRMAAIASLRNRVAHGYGSVDLDRIWREIPDGVATLVAFTGAIAGFIEPPPPPAR
jgi:uncharacterized protein YutE (UPF0331/DUF86 family)